MYVHAYVQVKEMVGRFRIHESVTQRSILLPWMFSLLMYKVARHVKG